MADGCYPSRGRGSSGPQTRFGAGSPKPRRAGTAWGIRQGPSRFAPARVQSSMPPSRTPPRHSLHPGHAHVIAVLAALVLAAAAHPAPAPRARAGPAPVTFVPVGAREVRGIGREPGASVTLVNVWAAWCGPCREEFADLLRVGRDYRARGLRLALVSADFDSATARAFLVERGVSGRTYFKVGGDQGFIDALDRRWSGSLPATFVYDRTGRRVSFWEGKASYARFEQAVRKALAANSVQPPSIPQPKETHRWEPAIPLSGRLRPRS
jgi:thiol-disulfide isomerase/thioredoxin